MAKAKIETRDGTKIIVEGNPEEISKIMKFYEGSAANKKSEEFRKFSKTNSRTKPTVTDKIRELIAEGFFDKPKTLAELKAGLEEQACFVPITTLSARMLFLTKNKELRRERRDGKWGYVGR